VLGDELRFLGGLGGRDLIAEIAEIAEEAGE
jgi:hypothetical protein